MLREEVIRRLQQHQADLKRLGVEHLYLFGSTGRGEVREDSDVDLFFDHEKGKLGLFELMDVKERPAGILGRKTDIMTPARRKAASPILSFLIRRHTWRQGRRRDSRSCGKERGELR
jgi:predicted nucleotidyltransferase